MISAVFASLRGMNLGGTRPISFPRRRESITPWWRAFGLYLAAAMLMDSRLRGNDEGGSRRGAEGAEDAMISAVFASLRGMNLGGTRPISFPRRRESITPWWRAFGLYLTAAMLVDSRLRGNDEGGSRRGAEGAEDGWA